MEIKMNIRNLDKDPFESILNPISSIRVLIAGETVVEMQETEEQTVITTEESKSEESLLGPEQVAGYAVTAVFVIIGLLISYIILKKFLFKPVFTVINKRRETILAELTEASEKNIQAQTSLENAQAKIDESEREASNIVIQARVQAEKQAEIILEKAKEDAAEMIRKAENASKHTHDVMLDQMRNEISDLAVSIATKVIGSVIDEKRQKKMSDKLLDEALNTEVHDSE